MNICRPILWMLPSYRLHDILGNAFSLSESLFYSLDRIETNRPSSALASQSLSVVSELIPYVRETFRRHLNQAEAVLLVDFDKLKRASGPFHELFSLSFRHTLVLVWQYSAAPIQVTRSHLTRKSWLACFCAVVVHFSHKLST